MAYWTDKVALVTGGSQGLGLAIAQALVASGAKVIIVARDQERLAAVAQQLSTSDRQCGWLPADITVQDQVDALIDQALRLHGRLDAVFNVAGKSDRGAIEDVTAGKLYELLELNFLSAVRITKAALPSLIQTRGHVVLIGSLAAKSASRYLGAYPASKFPLVAYAQQLRLELGPQGLHSLLVCPGPITRNDAGHRYDNAAASLPPEARRPGGGVKLRGIRPNELAERILRACEQRQSELIVPARAKWLFALSQISPTFGDWLLNRMTR